VADLASILRENVRARLRSLGMSDADLARKAGISKTYVSQLLRDDPQGRNDNPGIKQLERIAKALETTVPRLLAGPEDQADLKNSVRSVLEFLQGLDQADDASVRTIVDMLRKR
jgi:transcriptional regulator with XRE-family HTH domain